MPGCRPCRPSTKGALAFFGFPALAAILVIWLASRTLFRGDALDADKLAHEVEREVARLTGPDWPIKTLLAGVSLGAVAGIPVAVALWVTRSPIARSGMLAGIVIFAAGMLLWAILMAFAIRSATLYLYRGMITRG